MLALRGGNVRTSFRRGFLPAVSRKHVPRNDRRNDVVIVLALLGRVNLCSWGDGLLELPFWAIPTERFALH